MKRVWWHWIAPLILGFVALMTVAGVTNSESATGVGLLLVLLGVFALNYPRGMFRRDREAASNDEPSIVVVQRRVRAEEKPPPESALRRAWRWFKEGSVPIWLGTPLMYLGLAFIAFKPFSLLAPEWVVYVAALVVAVIVGWRVAPRYEVTVLSRSADELIVRRRIRRRSPVTSSEAPAASETTSQLG